MSKDAPLTPDFNLLPNDPQLLKQLIAELMIELSKKDGRIEQLQHRMDLLLRRLYGASSEKFDPRQASLFETTPPEPAAAETIAEHAADNPPAAEPETSRTTSSRSGHGRPKGSVRIVRPDDPYDSARKGLFEDYHRGAIMPCGPRPTGRSSKRNAPEIFDVVGDSSKRANDLWSDISVSEPLLKES